MATPWVVGVERPLDASTYDEDGAPSNAVAVTVTITRPDGTTVTPTVANIELGRYRALFNPSQVGTHGVLWTVDGTDYDGTFGPDSFHVQDSTLPAVGLVEVKAHLNITSTGDDGELLSFIHAATAGIEAKVGPLTRRTVTQTHNGGTHSVLLSPPVVSVTSVTENGTTVPSTGYSVSESGVLTRVNGYSRSVWTDGFNNISVTFVGGRTSIPADLRQAVMVLVQHLWETQRGRSVRQRGGDEYVPGVTYTYPRRVLELIAPYEQPGIA